MNKQSNELENYSITHWYQPIYNISKNEVIGYEALLRSTLCVEISPLSIFNNARKEGILNALDLISIKSSCESVSMENGQLFINVFPSTILTEGFIDWCKLNIPDNSSVVFELLETEEVRDWSTYSYVIKSLQNMGIGIAVDDLGSGYSFFKQWIELEPDFIKIDRYFTQNLTINPKKQKTLEFLQNLLEDSSKIIIEGVEQYEDLQIIRDIGISFAQGYLFGKPSPLISLATLTSYK